MVIAAREDPGRTVRLLGRLGIAVTLVVVAWTLLSTIAHVNVSQATLRLASVTRVTSDPVASQSLTERVTQSRVAWKSFAGAPLDGVGPGHNYVWRDQVDQLHIGSAMDTPVLFLAKFGLLGIGFLFLAGYWGREFVRTLGTRRRGEPARLALIGYSAFWLLFLPLGLPLEDKGFALAMILLTALAIVERLDARLQIA
jgi:hypothetical protein